MKPDYRIRKTKLSPYALRVTEDRQGYNPLIQRPSELIHNPDHNVRRPL